MSGRHIVLVPGFFGFVNFGELVYFQHLKEVLLAKMRELGREVEIHSARVSPTASLRSRSAAVALQIREWTEPDDRIAIVGHSSGGLDARLIVSPGADLGLDFDLEEVAARVDTVVTVAAPHYGTPLAELFVGLLGQKILRLLSMVTVEALRDARLPIRLLAKIAATITRARFPGGKTVSLLDHLHTELLETLPGDERDEIGRFFEQVGDDQSLLSQITPAGADLFNASTSRRDGVRYGCVVAVAPRPSLGVQLRLPKQSMVQAGYLLYRWLDQAAAAEDLARPPLLPEQREAVRAGLGKIFRADRGDGIVPGMSQIYGDVVWAGSADHLDVIGHFHGPRLSPRHHDWLMTGARFGGDQFSEMWARVASFIERDSDVPVG